MGPSRKINTLVTLSQKNRYSSTILEEFNRSGRERFAPKAPPLPPDVSPQYTTYLDGGARQLSPVAEEKLDVLSEPTGVVVSDSPSVPEGLEDRVGLQHPLLDGAQLVSVSRGIAEDGKVLNRNNEARVEKMGEERPKKKRAKETVEFSQYTADYYC